MHRVVGENGPRREASRESGTRAPLPRV